MIIIQQHDEFKYVFGSLETFARRPGKERKPLKNWVFVVYFFFATKEIIMNSNKLKKISKLIMESF